MTRHILLLPLLALLAACGAENEDDLFGDDCDLTAVSYAADIAPIIETRCATTGCHVAGGSGPGILETYANVKAMVDAGTFEDRVIVQQNMPPSTPLDDCQIDQIEDWLAQGAPDN